MRVKVSHGTLSKSPFIPVGLLQEETTPVIKHDDARPGASGCLVVEIFTYFVIRRAGSAIGSDHWTAPTVATLQIWD